MKNILKIAQIMTTYDVAYKLYVGKRQLWRESGFKSGILITPLEATYEAIRVCGTKNLFETPQGPNRMLYTKFHDSLTKEKKELCL